MKTYIETVEVTLVVETCCVCGVRFGLPSEIQLDSQRHQTIFYCPNGHAQAYTGKSIEKRLEETEKILQKAEESVRWWKGEAEQTGRKLISTRGVVTRLKNRIANGVCPCCHRQFVNLQRHMTNQHPEFRSQGEIVDG